MGRWRWTRKPSRTGTTRFCRLPRSMRGQRRRSLHTARLRRPLPLHTISRRLHGMERGAEACGKGVPVAGETDLHKTLKKEACRWLFRMGYRCIAAEVRLPPLGIIDAVGTGVFRPYHNYLCIPRELPQ